MTEHNENKANRIDMISSLQMKNTHHNEKKNEVEDIDDGWSDYDEIDDEEVGGKPSQTQNTNKNDTSSKMIVKAEVKSKKFTNLKDYLGAEAGGNNQNKYQSHNSNFHHKKKQGGNFYKEGPRGDRDKKDFSGKPSFVNLHKDNVGMDQPANSDFDSIINNNTEYSQRSFQTGNNQYSNTTKSYNNNYREHNNNNYNSQRNPDYKKHDPKDDVMNTIKNFGKVLSGINEENKNLKDSTRGYIAPTIEETTYSSRGNNQTERPVYSNRENNQTERPAYSNKDNNQTERPTYSNKDNNQTERPTYSNRDNQTERPNYSNRDNQTERPNYSNRDNQTERPNYSNRGNNNNNYNNNSNSGSANNFNSEHKPAPKNEFQKPTFVNSSLENKPNNFKELDQSGDPYLKKLQEQIDEPQHYQKRIIKNQNNIKEKETAEIVGDVIEKLEEVHIHAPVHTERFESSNKNKGNKYGRKYNNNNNANYCSEDEIWNKVVSKSESVSENVKQEDAGFYDNVEKKFDASEEKSYGGKKHDYDYNKNKRPSKRNSNVNNVEEPKKKIILKDKVVLTTGNFKSIKDIFG